MTDHQPNDLEDRIRDAYQTAGRTVQTLQRTSPVRAAGSVRRPRRMNVLTPIAAAAAVIVVIAASVALPRLLAGSTRNPAPQVSAAGHYPPFQVVVTDKSNSDSSLQVESAATGHVVTTVALPWKGAAWGAVAAVGNTGRFIVAAAPKNVPSRGFSYPTRLYTLTLSARGTVADLTPLGVPVLQGQVTSLAASADGRTVAYTLVPFDSRSDHWVGIITGRTTRQWSIGGLTRTGQGTYRSSTSRCPATGAWSRSSPRIRSWAKRRGCCRPGPRRAASRLRPGGCISRSRPWAPGTRWRGWTRR